MNRPFPRLLLPRFIVSLAVLFPITTTAATTSWGEVSFQKRVLTAKYYSDGVAIGDINGDGQPDVVAGPFWYPGPEFTTARAFYTPIPLPPEASPSNSMFSFVRDFDRDGKADILVLGRVHKHQAKWYRNPGNASELWKSHIVFERIRGESPMLVELTRGGPPQLLCHWDGRWGFVSPAPKSPFTPWRFQPIGENRDWPQFYHGQGVGDVNGDGLRDVILNDGWYEHLRGDGLWKFHEHRFAKGRGGAQMFVYDVDGDGDQDIISALDAHGWGLAWFEQMKTESGLRFRQHKILGDRSELAKFGAAFSQPHALALADIDGDGLQDIVTGKRRWAHGPKGDIEPNADPVVYWFRLTRSAGEARYEPQLIDDKSGVGVQIATGDLDADGRCDVVTASKLGVFVFLNRAEKPFRIPSAKPQTKP